MQSGVVLGVRRGSRRPPGGDSPARVVARPSTDTSFPPQLARIRRSRALFAIFLWRDILSMLDGCFFLPPA